MAWEASFIPLLTMNYTTDRHFPNSNQTTLNQLAVSYLQLAAKHLSLNISLHGTYLLLQKCVFLLSFLFLSMRSFSPPHLRSIVFPAQIRAGTRLAMQRDRGEQLHTSHQNYSNSWTSSLASRLSPLQTTLYTNGLFFFLTLFLSCYCSNSLSAGL